MADGIYCVVNYSTRTIQYTGIMTPTGQGYDPFEVLPASICQRRME
jgi:hypothetical protein